ncbi:efflux RND transporter permease subunit [Crenalkalicoccus roseus]|uniref:efflux RND transporter permease subunit n=1 Tax=Crenalkalicoccus roseus TaxID=1485588 RepID=UPI001081B2EE|nr:efflux RND transporter permease subunit [Crenalkalicoccus roseus]
MRTLIGAAFSRPRTVLLLLVLILTAGALSYIRIPKEAAPEIDIPIFNVSVLYPGISAEDSARLLVRPLERQLQGMQGLRLMTARAGEGFATLTLEFAPGADHQRALTDVRDRVDIGRAELPPGADPPLVTEVDLALFPIVTVTLSGPVSERALLGTARALRDRLEALPGVLEVDIAGEREDLMEILVDPVAVESYRISYEEVMQAVERNNRLIAAGAFDTGAGRIPVSIPGVIEGPEDVLNMPVRVTNGTVVRLGDVATVRQAFRDPQGFARVDGEPALALEVRRASGANVIATVAAVRAAVEEERAGWPPEISVRFLQDQAQDIASLLGDLENNVIAAVVLVMLTVVLALGVRASFLVAVAIPGAFLAGILTIHAAGLTLNIVVLFALILVIGMLVDGAIVVVEQAFRHIGAGMGRREAFLRAATRMAWPVTASTATTLAVFVPLLFWPGTAGQFMLYLPVTVLVTLTASLLMALVFVPVLGAALAGGRQGPAAAAGEAAEEPPGRLARRYRRVLRRLVARPGWTLAGAAGLLLGGVAAYAALGRGVDFFPAVEPDFLQVQVQTRGNLSVREADALMRLVEERLLGVPEVASAYARTIGSVQARLQANLPEDAIGTIRLDLVDWRLREPASRLVERLRERVADLPGLLVQFREQERGPSAGRPIEIEVASRETARIAPAVERIRALMDGIGGFADVSDDRPLPGIELRLGIDREEAARYGADIATLGSAVLLLTEGVLLGRYRPDFTDEEVEIRLRFPPAARTLGQLGNLRVSTARGLVPIANFVSFEPAPGTGVIRRVNGRRVHTISADAAPGHLVSAQIEALRSAIAEAGLDPGVEVVFRGQAEDQAEAGSFLVAAFATAVALMFLILVTQFNSLFQALLVLSAIVFSTAGILLGLMIRQEPFGVVMSGIGAVALAGIVVNNNIVLIDAYNEYRGRGLPPREAAVLAGTQRFRPVLLTAVTTIVGLMPMVLGLTVDFVGRDIHVGAPSTQYWVQLATAIAGGLAVATPITLLLTPALLAWRDGGRRRPGRGERGGA